MLTKKVVEEWVDHWLLDQPYVALQEEYLMMIDTPSFLSQNTSRQGQKQSVHLEAKQLTGSHNILGTNTSTLGLTPVPQLTADSLGQSIEQLKQNKGGMSLAQFEQALHNQGEQELIPSTGEFLRQYQAHDQSSTHYPNLTPYPPMNLPGQDSGAREVSHMHLSRDEEVFDSQDGAYIEPEPIRTVSMDDPPRHEVTSIEEEVRSDLGWFHLKTSDLAPFKPVIQTSIYVGGEREVVFEDHYEGIYQNGGYGTQIEKRVERIHHESVKLLQKGGIQLWWEHKQV